MKLFLATESYLDFEYSLDSPTFPKILIDFVYSKLWSSSARFLKSIYSFYVEFYEEITSCTCGENKAPAVFEEAS